MNRRGFLHSGALLGLSPMLGRAALAFPATTLTADYSRPIRLNANENALGLSPKALEAATSALSESHRYPFSVMPEFQGRLAARHGVEEGHILLGNGSSELLRLVVGLFDPDRSLVLTADPTYEAVSGHADTLGLRVTRIPLRSDFSHDLEAMRPVVAGHRGPVLVYLCNPNNPTGTITPAAGMREWMDEAPPDTLFLVDEAYHDYAEDPRYDSLVGEATRRDNLLVTRTFSKVYAMAGLRLGYLVGAVKWVRRLDGFTRLNVSSVALAAASASLDDRAFVQRSIQSNQRGKTMLYQTLNALKVPYLPSDTNFVMFKVNGGLADFRRRMASSGVQVGRPFPPLLEYCRVTIGLPEEMETFCGLLRDFRAKQWV